MANKETPAQRRDRMYNEARAAKTSDIPNAHTHKIPNQVGIHIPNQVKVEMEGGYGGSADRMRMERIRKITEGT